MARKMTVSRTTIRSGDDELFMARAEDGVGSHRLYKGCHCPEPSISHIAIVIFIAENIRSYTDHDLLFFRLVN